MSKFKILILGIPLLPLFVASPACAAKEKILGYMRPISGEPFIVHSRAEKLSLKRECVRQFGRDGCIQPGDRISTGRGSRVAIHFVRSATPDCRLVLEANSSLKLTGLGSEDTYLAELGRGVVRCASPSCGMSLSVRTPMGILTGKNAVFSLQVFRHATIVELKSGRMSLFVNGQIVPLREMTRTTVSKTGGHRIATMYDGGSRISPFLRPPAIPFTIAFLKKLVFPASATESP